MSPNIREAEEIVGHEFSDEADLVAAAETLTHMGAESALIHHEDGCVARIRAADVKGGQGYVARLPRRTDVVSTVGSGDSFLAGYLSARYGRRPPEAALALAVACGAASTQKFGAGVFDPSDVEALMRRVEVERVD